LNDKELRLKVLSILYQAAKEAKQVPGTMADPRIKGISIEEYQWTSYYLIEHKLVHGEITNTNAGPGAWAGRISGHGMDIIENLVDRSIKQVEENKISFSNKAITYLEKLLELVGIWSQNPDLHQKAWELLTDLVK